MTSSHPAPEREERRRWTLQGGPLGGQFYVRGPDLLAGEEVRLIPEQDAEQMRKALERIVAMDEHVPLRFSEAHRLARAALKEKGKLDG